MLIILLIEKNITKEKEKKEELLNTNLLSYSTKLQPIACYVRKYKQIKVILSLWKRPMCVGGPAKTIKRTPQRLAFNFLITMYTFVTFNNNSALLPPCPPFLTPPFQPHPTKRISLFL